jgi:curved DNA-binding protein
MRDPYAVLGVARGADADEIRKVFKKLARQYHPDLNKAPEAADRFKEINQAYEIIGDADKRALWDEFGEVSTRPGFDAAKARAWKQGGGGPGGGFGAGFGGGGVDLDEFFSFFAGRGPQGPRRGADVEAQVQVPLMALISGEPQELHLGRPGEEPESIKVRIPRGTRPGETIRLRGKGREGRGGPPGDLLLTVDVAPHPHLRLDGDDLEMDLPITISEAVAGARIEVPTPDGPLRVRVPPGTTGGQRLRVKDRGLPRRDGDRGHLFLVLRPVAPRSDDPRARELAEELDRFYGEDVRAGLAI